MVVSGGPPASGDPDCAILLGRADNNRLKFPGGGRLQIIAKFGWLEPAHR
jgi:hypothetical protein